MSRGPIVPWTRTRRSIARLSASVPSRHTQFSVAYTTNIAESNFRYTQASWDALHGRFEMKRINHEEAYSMDGACTNCAEEFFSRMRRAEIGHHHHIAGVYLLRYAQETTWREDNRRASNGEQVSRLAGLAIKNKPSVDFSGYWQRHKAA